MCQECFDPSVKVMLAQPLPPIDPGRSRSMQLHQFEARDTLLDRETSSLLSFQALCFLFPRQQLNDSGAASSPQCIVWRIICESEVADQTQMSLARVPVSPSRLNSTLRQRKASEPALESPLVSCKIPPGLALMSHELDIPCVTTRPNGSCLD
ncbi:hypothetical protein CONLIGDRAFT_423425 [Coniochaeta ligniaria NRRL 30616]|uniref:Uncharacterized protein n=1 Tax=Coniochaeta ligniaria NRRL 30616 TaxID=1408157 RepID=A0A1J7IHV6_9PEZI|nr:hypothetical protein CONLIGDRAFT_423425 [Coniochaeta ligniaria NRRL 30616]